MTWKERWHTETNPATGSMFEQFDKYMRDAHNGLADVERFFETAYGEELTRRLENRFALEYRSMSPEDLAHYKSLGLEKRIYNAQSYYRRFTLLMPDYMTIGDGRVYPLVIACHGYGNAIENEEYLWGFSEIAAREGFMVVLPQDTNWQSLGEILDCLCKTCPVDRERVYIAGYSQGGNKATTAMFMTPERFAAAAPCGCDIDCSMDSFGNAFTREQTLRLRRLTVPFLQIVGTCERAGFVPLNSWAPMAPGTVRLKTWSDPRRNDLDDPTIRVIDGAPQPSAKDMPDASADGARWKLSRLNHRLWLQNCAPRDIERCMNTSFGEQSEVRRALGFYGDSERTETLLGVKHFICDIYSHTGLNTFRMVAMENGFHCIPVTFGMIAWEYFKQFRRDGETGRLATDPYEKPQ